MLCTSIMLMSPCHYFGYPDPTSVENWIWGDRIGTRECDADGSRLLFGALLEVCGQLSYPNLRTGSWSDHPLK
jgi:hypothetical protein